MNVGQPALGVDDKVDSFHELAWRAVGKNPPALRGTLLNPFECDIQPADVRRLFCHGVAQCLLRIKPRHLLD
jgi:hypothetical protein